MSRVLCHMDLEITFIRDISQYLSTNHSPITHIKVTFTLTEKLSMFVAKLSEIFIIVSRATVFSVLDTEHMFSDYLLIILDYKI